LGFSVRVMVSADIWRMVWKLTPISF